MAVHVSTGSPVLASRGSEGLHLWELQDNKLHPHKSLRDTPDCRVMAFTSDGALLAFVDSTGVHVLNLSVGDERCHIPRPKTRLLQFSPLGTYVAIWEPYTVVKSGGSDGGGGGSPNLQVWSSELVAEFYQKKHQEWCPQWSDDEQLCARSVTNEVHFYEDGSLGSQVTRKLKQEGLACFAISPGLPPYHVAVYTPGKKGAPSFVQLYQYPRVEGAGAVIANKSFYKADTVQLKWNKKGSGLLVLTTVDVDKSGASYYGEQGLHYLSVRGDGNMVHLDKKGPIYAVEWSPSSNEFCVVYGFMPSKAALFNCKCELVFDFGITHRNMALYNPHGNILCLAGFGNLRGNMEFWDCEKRKLIVKTQASDSTHLEWCSDSTHVVTATTAPRLREGNGFKVWHYSGALLHHTNTPPRHELWEAAWRPSDPSTYAFPDPSQVKVTSDIELPAAEVKPAVAYVPPALRGKPRPPKQNEEKPVNSTTPQNAEHLSKSAAKNKKKREAQKRSKQLDKSGEKEEKERRGGSRPTSEEQGQALATASYLLQDSSLSKPATGAPAGDGKGGGRGTGPGDSDKEKKLKNLRKKLRQIEQLKQQQAEGRKLEANQIDKLKMEQPLLEEIEKLSCS